VGDAPPPSSGTGRVGQTRGGDVAPTASTGCEASSATCVPGALGNIGEGGESTPPATNSGRGDVVLAVAGACGTLALAAPTAVGALWSPLEAVRPPLGSIFTGGLQATAPATGWAPL